MITWKELEDASPSLTDKKIRIPDILKKSAEDFLKVLNLFRAECGIPMVPSSFYRSVEHEKKRGRSGKSNHTQCIACDFVDRSRKLTNYILQNPDILEKYDLYMEDPKYTPTWVHLTIAKKSKRIFVP